MRRHNWGMKIVFVLALVSAVTGITAGYATRDPLGFVLIFFTPGFMLAAGMVILLVLLIADAAGPFITGESTCPTCAAAGVVLCLAAFVGFGVHSSKFFYKRDLHAQQARYEKVVTLLEQTRAEQGRYPKTIAELRKIDASLPQPLSYETSNGSFRLTILAPDGWHVYGYSSEQKKWSIVD